MRSHIAAVLLGAMALLVGGPGAAEQAWAADGEAVASFRSEIVIDGRGALHVTETIGYRFGDTPRHGLLRELRTRSDTAGRYPVTEVRVSSPTEAPTETSVSHDGSDSTEIKIGDPTRTVSGDQTYVLSYTVDGQFSRIGSAGDELSWDMTGNRWTVPIEQFTARVTAPQAPRELHCLGPGCSTQVDGAAVAVAAGPVTPGEGMLLQLTYPSGTVSGSDSVFQRSTGTSPSQASPTSPGEKAVGAAMLFAILAVLGGGAWALLRLLSEPSGGRAGVRAAAAQQVGSRASERVPARTGAIVDHDVPLRPPDVGQPQGAAESSPGLLATLDSEGARAKAVTATLLDLAARGHLRIEEASGRPQRWRLVVDTPPAADSPLPPHEQTLLDTLFPWGPQREVGHGELQLLPGVQLVQRELVAAAVAHGWLAHEKRGRWYRAAGLIAFGAFALIGILVKAFGQDAFFVSCVAGGVVGLIAFVYCNQVRPLRRTPAGDAVLAGLDAHREQMAPGVDPDPFPLGTAIETFTRSLPSAVAVGTSRSWGRRLAGVRGAPPWAEASDWYRPAQPEAGLTDVTRKLNEFIDAMNARPTSEFRSIGENGAGYRSSGFGFGFSDSSSSSSSSSFGDSGGGSSSGGSSDSGGGSSW